MGISPCGVHEQRFLMVPHSFSESLRAFLKKYIPPSCWLWNTVVNQRSLRNLWLDSIKILNAFVLWSKISTSINSKLSQILKETLKSSVLSLIIDHKLWVRVNK